MCGERANTHTSDGHKADTLWMCTCEGDDETGRNESEFENRMGESARVN